MKSEKIRVKIIFSVLEARMNLVNISISSKELQDSANFIDRQISRLPDYLINCFVCFLLFYDFFAIFFFGKRFHRLSLIERMSFTKKSEPVPLTKNFFRFVDNLGLYNCFQGHTDDLFRKFP